MKRYISAINSEIAVSVRALGEGMSLRSLVLKPHITFAKIYGHFASDSLYRNSIYLMLSTAIMAFFGFFFWIINARLYTPEQVGIATTLISVMGLIAGFSNLGLNVGLVRFLPTSENKNELINSSFLISSLIALVLSVIFLLGLHVFSPRLLFLRENTIYAISFVLFVVALANNIIVEALFVAYRSAKYTLVKNSVLSLTKLFLTLALIAFSAFGIFTAVGLANIIALTLAVFILIKLFNFRVAYKHNLNEIKKISSYSFGNYIAGFFGSLPVMALPLIIIDKIGAAEAGYFYIALMIANFLFIIPGSITQSLFAEGSHRESEMREHIKKSVKITALLLLPAILITIFFGNYILLAFGKSYSEEAFRLLQLMAISGIFVAINSICGTVLRVRNRVKDLIGVGVFSALSILLLSFLFIKMQLLGIGWAWIIGQATVAIIYVFVLLSGKRNSVSY